MIRKLSSPLLLLLLLAMLSHCQCEVSKSIGFSLKLVQRGFQQQNEIPVTRASYLQNAISETKRKIFPITIRPHITYSDYTVTIGASIGTPSERKTFIFDTASSLTWTQCSPCKHCFNQTLPLFDPQKSTSYTKMKRSHQFSTFFNTSRDESVVYVEKYLANQTSEGIVSLETLSFLSNVKAVRKIIDNIVFGCANNNLGNWPNNSPITGIMAVDGSPLSLISQIGGKLLRRFSYCLPRLSSPIKTTFLRFGDDVKTRPDVLTTSLKSNTSEYVVNLQGISIAGRRVKLPKHTFSNGCLIATGFPGSVLETRAYTQVVKILTQHFDRFKLERLNGPPYQGKLCYQIPHGFNSFPNMTFHFKGSVFSRGADFQIRPENLFAHGGDVYCMIVYKHAKRTILGAFQMQNVRFILDIVASKVSFGGEDCSKDKAIL